MEKVIETRVMVDDDKLREDELIKIITRSHLDISEIIQVKSEVENFLSFLDHTLNRALNEQQLDLFDGSKGSASPNPINRH